MAASACPTGSDCVFGPRVDVNCRSFDFTLLFEDAFLTCLSAAAFLMLCPSQLFWLSKQRPVCSTPLSSKLFLGKGIGFIAICACQLALLVLRTKETRFKTEASLAGDILSLLATASAVCLSYLSHQRSLRPSTLLILYLSVTVVLGIARVRTSWLIDGTGREPAAFSLIWIFTSLQLLLESIEKKSSLEPDAKHGAPEQYSSFWNRTFFTWLAATFRAGYLRIITIGDLPPLDTQLETYRLRQTLVKAWSNYDRNKKNTLLLACFRAFIRSFLSGVLPRLCLTVFTFTQPFLVNTTIDYVGQDNVDTNYGKGLIGAWALVFVGIAVSTGVARYQTTRFNTRLRGSLIGLVYQQAVRTRAVDAGDITAVSLMGTDIERIALRFMSIHESWCALIDICVAIWLLERQLSIAAVAPIFLSIIFMAIVSKLSGASKDAQVAWIEKVQERLKITSSTLGDMKAVKMLGMSNVMFNIIQGLRQMEIATSKRFRKFLVLQLLLSNIPTNLAPALTFVVYAIIAVCWRDESLLTGKAFTSITLIQLLTTPVLMYIQVIPGLVQCIGSFERIQMYCNYSHNTEVDGKQQSAHEVQTSNISLATLTPIVARNVSSQIEEHHIFTLDGHDFAWNKEQPAVLKDVKMKFEQRKIITLVGPVGSGKSTLLESILGETLSSSSVLRIESSTAYCAQQPWLENDTIRANILGVSSYDRKWYDQVKAYCGLVEDFQTMAQGDRTKIGSKGLNISGGQKQRIALARAIYSRSRLILLDDVFSGMDAHTVEAVSRQLLGLEGYFRRNGITVVLATHNRMNKLMSLADVLIVLENGKVTEYGSPQTLMQKNGYIYRLGLDLGDRGGMDVMPEITNVELEELTSITSNEKEGPEDDLENDLRRKNGDASVYKYYLTSAGYLVALVFFLAMMSWAFFTEFPSIWLNWWSEENTIEPNHNIWMYIGVLAALGVAGTISVCVACWFGFVEIISKTALKIHADLLESTLRAPLNFFVSTDTGSLTNRFSQDMELIDMSLPLVMCDYVSAIFTMTAKGIILFVFSQYLAVVVPFIGAAVYFLQNFYLYTSRQVRLLEIEAKAPLYTHFIETVAGAATVRAFGWQEHYQARNDRFIDTSQRPMYLQQCIRTWLVVMLDLLVCGIAVLLVGIIVGWRDKFSAGSVGVSLVMVVTFSGVLARVIVMWTRMESSIGAVARVQRFIDNTEREEEDGYGEEVPKLWPHTGQVDFCGLVASYTHDAEPVLKGLSMSIKPKQHVAVCGRSGSGKTSLILTLLKMVHKQTGSIVVDGVDISTLSCSDIRLALNVVPQDPLLLPGTVRFNVDPFGKAHDAEIIKVLDRVKLWKVLEEKGGLSEELHSEALSAGQRQLLCLARAMVRKGKILIIDEATSSVDSETETIMQDVIDTEFKQSTVLAVMHRLNHVLKYNKVALLGDGVLLEFDDTASLLAKETQFAELYRSSSR